MLIFMLTATASGAKEFSEQQPAKIFMVLWRGCEEACQGFKQQFIKQQLPVQFVMRDAGRDKSKLSGFLAQAKSDRPDLVVTWGTTVTKAVIGTLEIQAQEEAKQSLKTNLGDIPALFMIVADPIGAKIIHSYEDSGRDYVTGVRNRVPEEVQIKVIQSYLGEGRKRIGVIYSTAELNSTLNTQQLHKLSSKMGFDLLEYTYVLDDNARPVSGQIPTAMSALKAKNVDIIYVGSSSYNRHNRDEFVEQARLQGIPVASAYQALVTDSGGLLAVANRYYNVGKLAANQAKKILFENTIPRQLAIPALSRYSVVINMDLARQLSLYPPIQLLKIAEIINP